MKKIIFLLTSISFFTFAQTNLSVTNVNSNDVTFNWDNGGCTAGNYLLRYKEDISGSSWSTTTTISNTGGSQNYILSGLNANTTYIWRIKCGNSGSWVYGTNFTTNIGCNITTLLSVTNALCSNIYDGAIDLSISNAASPISYLWSNNATTQDISGLSSGTYFVQITDNNGCTENDTAIVGINGSESLTQTITDFSPNPLNGYHQWSYDTLTIQNTGCDVRVRPEFSVNCSAGPISQGDFVLKWQSPLGNTIIPYSIDQNGNAIGYWTAIPNDSTGYLLGALSNQQVIVQVKFVNPAQYGIYTATWQTFKVDATGNKLNSLSSPNNVSLSLVDCSNFTVNTSGNSVTCFGGNDGTASSNINGGSGNYSYLWSNGSNNANITNLTAGSYSLIVTDNLWGCIDSSSILIDQSSTLNATSNGTHVTCNGLTDGSISLNVSGGSGLFDYIWVSHPSLPQLPNQTNLPADTYVIDVVDLTCGNVSTTSFIITEPDLLTYTSTFTNNTSCDSNNCNGSINIAISGGTPPYNLLWNNGYIDSIRNDLCGDTYTINIQDSNGCGNLSEIITIADSSSSASGSIDGTNISCFGGNDGTATATAGSSNSSNGNISNLNYCNSIPGTNAYSNIELIRIYGDGDSISNNTTGLCDTYEDYTSLYTTVTPGQTYSLEIILGTCTPGQYQIDSGKVFIDWNIDGDFNDSGEIIGSFGGTQSPITANISFTVPNIAYGPTTIRIVSQAQANNPSFPNGVITSCDVGDFGALGTYNQPWWGATEDYSLVISGITPATFLWNTGDTSSSITGLSEGTYTCVISDTNNCSVTKSITLTEPNELIVSTIVSDLLCFQDNSGNIDLTVTGGSSPYSFLWNGPNGYTNNIEDLTGLQAGNYSVSITDANGCQTNSSITLNEPNSLAALTLSSDLLCFQDNSGNIDLTVTGGSTPYSFLWNGPNGYTNNIEDLSGLQAGNYNVSITDSNGCQTSTSVSLIEPSDILVIENISNTSCNGTNDGSVTLSITGGTPNYTEDWGNSNPLALSAGNYNYTITDSNGCSYTNSVTINEPSIITTTEAIANVSCYGFNDGSVTLSISGGTPNYIEDWGNNNPSALSAGNYNYTIIDSNGCSYTNSVIISEPDSIDANEFITNASCFGSANGAATITFSGGTTDYILSWDTLTYPLLGGLNIFTTPIGVPAGIYPYGVIDANGCVYLDTIIINQPTEISVIETITNVSCYSLSDGSVSLSISGGIPNYIEDWGSNNPLALSAGNYNYTITDSNGCSINSSITISEPNEITTSLNITNLSSCVVSNGSIDLNITGGTMPYTYLWNNNDTTQDIFNLSAGNFYVTIIDSNGCIAYDTANVNQPSNNLSLMITTSDYNGSEISCFNSNDGNVYANVSGGTGAISYLWSNMSTNSSLTNQIAGTYSITISDSIGCSLTDSVLLNQPNPLTTINNITNVSCNGFFDGNAEVIINGGTSDYILSWDTLTYPLVGGLNIFTTPIGVPAGIYPFGITDINGCEHLDTIVINQPNPITSSANISDYNGYNVSCNGYNNGNVTLNLNGGSGSLIANWGIHNPLALSAGNYYYTITDSLSCIYTDSVNITEPNALNILFNSSNLSCWNACDGYIISDVSGGTPNYTYNWNNGSSGDSIINLCSNNYILTVIDQNNCIISDSVHISQPSEINIQIDSILHVSTYNGNDGAIFITATNGVGLYSYIWNGPQSFNSSNQNIQNLITGWYEIQVIDSTNCVKYDSIFVDEPPSLVISLDSSSNANCFGSCDGHISITASGGDSTYSYQWTGPNGFISNNEDINNLCAGVYELILSDSSDSIYTSYTIHQPSQLSIVTYADTAICFGGLAQVTAYTYGGVFPYITNWNNTTNSITTHVPSGMHYVTVIDHNNCMINDSVYVYQNDSMEIIANANDISCYGLSDGSVTININSGATPPFMYSIDLGQNFQSNNSFTNLNSGQIQFTIIDSNGCLGTVYANINEPQLLSTNMNSQNVSCYGSCDGIANISISGGTSPYNENWLGLDQNNLCAGLVNVIIEDDNGCLSTNSVIIHEPNPIIISINVNNNILQASSGFLSYQWLDNNGDPIDGATDSIYTPSGNGQYAVIVTDSNMCSDTSEHFSFIIESINDNFVEFSIYPNPSNGLINIHYPEGQNFEIKIINMKGNEILNTKVDGSMEQIVQLRLEEYPSGVYVIQLINNERIINYMLTLQ